MVENPADKIPAELRKHGDKIRKTIKDLKKKKPGNLDAKFGDLHEEVFSEIDCLTCGNCCKTTSPMLFEKDIERLAAALKMRIGNFVETYLYMDTDGLYAMKQTPCPFLGSDNYCMVYDARPKACREYPHTNQRKMHTLLSLAETNATICPAVLEIIKRFE
jgi:Fe-S-cluster containining protein